MKDLRVLATSAVFAGSAAVLAALGWSAFRLATLPAAGISLDALGLPRELDLERADVIADEARGVAWLVDSRFACTFDLAALQIFGCQNIPRAHEAPRVVGAGSNVIVAFADAKGPRRSVSFDWFALDLTGHVAARGSVGAGFPESWKHDATMLNLGWDPASRGASLAFVVNDKDAGTEVVRVPIAIDSEAPEPEVKRIDDGVVVAAAFAGDVMLLANRTLRRGEKDEPLEIPKGACVGNRSLSCVTVEGSPRVDEGPIAVLMSADGVVRRAADLPAVNAAARREHERYRVQHVTTYGLAAPEITVTAGDRLLAPIHAGRTAELEVRSAEDEHLLFGRVDGAWHRLARRASPIEVWTVIPHAKGVVAIDGRARVAVSLGPDLEPLSHPEPFPALVSLARERWTSADLDVKLFLLAAILALWVFALAARGELRRDRTRPRRALLALGAWAIGVLIFLVVRRAALFPP